MQESTQTRIGTPEKPEVELIDTDPSIAELSTADLMSRLSETLRTTADGLRQMAAIVAELERRGEDLSDMKLGLVGYLRRIASGQMLAETVVRFAGNPLALDRISRLPLDQQRRVAAGESFELAVWRDNGERTAWLKVDPTIATPAQIQQLFGPQGVRSKSEQVAILEDRRSRPPRKPATPTGKVRLGKPGHIKIGRTEFSIAEILKAIAGDNSEEEVTRNKSISINVSADELANAKIFAAKCGTSVQSIGMRALKAYRIITPQDEQ